MHENRERLKDCTEPIIKPKKPPKTNISPVDFRPQEIESFKPMTAYIGRMPITAKLMEMIIAKARDGEQPRLFWSHLLSLSKRAIPMSESNCVSTSRRTRYDVGTPISLRAKRTPSCREE